MQPLIWSAVARHRFSTVRLKDLRAITKRRRAAALQKGHEEAIELFQLARR